jgi:hypothetical protein
MSLYSDTLAACPVVVPLQDDAANTTVVTTGTISGSGTLTSGGNTADRTTTGPTTWLPKALQFNNSAYISLPQVEALKAKSAVTLACWINHSGSVTNGDTIVFASNGTNAAQSRAQIVWTTGGILQAGGRASDAESYRQYNTPASTNDGTWKHVAFIFHYATDSIDYYLNGAYVGSGLVGSWTGTATSNTDSLQMTIGGTSGGVRIESKLAQVCYFDSDIGGTAIAALYNGPPTFQAAWSRGSNLVLMA